MNLIQAFPKWIYHAVEKAKIIQTAEDLALHLAQGWVESPADLPKRATPSDPTTETSAQASSAPPSTPPVSAPMSAETAIADVAETEKAALYATASKVVVDKIKTASVETLQKIHGYEQANPDGPRKSVINAIVSGLKKAGVSVAETAATAAVTAVEQKA